jgi:CspA family cold shock protein
MSNNNIMMRILAFGAAVLALVASSCAFVLPSPLARHQFALSAIATDIKGTVKWFNSERGFGFIAVDGGGPDIYVHATGLTCEGPLIDGERVSFDTEIDKRTNKPKAVSVERASEEVAKTESAPAQKAPVTATKPITPTVFAVPKKEKLHAGSPPNETFQRSLLTAQIVNRSAAKKPITPTVFAVPKKEKLHVGSPPNEAFQRSLLAAQIANRPSPIRSVDYDAAARLAFEAAGGSGDFEVFKTKYLQDTSVMIGSKHKARVAEEAEAAEAARLAEEKRIAEEAAAAAAKAEADAAEAARLAEEKRIAEETAAKEAEDAKARDLGYPNAVVMKARQQPKSADEEAALAKRYGAMGLEERAFSILADLGIIELHLDPDDPNRDTSHDDDDME